MRRPARPSNPTGSLHVHVVSHTHWDREWYHVAERFRQRLVALVDELLDAPAAGAFLLDGQAVALDDYLAVRPERASELAAALRDGRLEAGPWYVLPDELIPRGEGLVRNLLAGAHAMRALRAESPPVLYCPDSFGHPAALPLLARGFGKDVVVVWRGLRAQGDTLWWRYADAVVLVHHLTRSGYELGASLPPDPDAARSRWRRIHDEFGSRATTGVALLLNGADHHARQHGRDAAITTLAMVAAPDTVQSSSLGAFARDLRARATPGSLPELRGELRDSYGYTWTLQGTLASRTHQKRRYAQVERCLVRDIEPWAAIATLGGAPSARHLMRAAWRSVLLCQPHDSLCGSSIDAVARAVDVRLDAASAQLDGLLEASLASVTGHDQDAARRSPDWKPVLLVRNAAARPRSGLAVVELVEKLADVPVGPGSKHVRIARPKRSVAPGSAAQVLEVTDGWERTEAPRAYPDNDAVRRTKALMLVDDVPGYGVRPASLPPGDAKAVGDPVRVSGRRITNGRLTLSWDARGALALADVASGVRVEHLIAWESRADVGDLYTPAIRARKLEPRLIATRVRHRGPLRGTVEQQWRLEKGNRVVDVALQLSVDIGAPFLRIAAIGVNGATDHRLRLLVRSGLSGAQRIIADAAFGTVERSVPRVDSASAAIEHVVPTAPLHRYVSAFMRDHGATLYADGLAEYEALPDGFAVTLVRAVGELSRSDLPERPGHAGWPASTPDAQCIGAFGGEFALMLHGAHSHTTVVEIERAADDVLLPLTGITLRSALRVPPTVHGVELDGDGLAFSTAKESEDGEWIVLRCLNLLDRELAGAWRLPQRSLQRARLARLDESPLADLPVRGDSVAFTAPAHGVVTVLVR